MNPQTISFYKQNITTAQDQIQRLSRTINRLAFLRLFVLLAGGTLLFQVVQTAHVGLTLLSFIATLLLFLLLVFFQSKTNHKKKAAECFKRINENEIAVDQNILQNGYDDGEAFIDDEHMNASDLDLFGRNSIFQLVSRCATYNGNKCLAKWLQDPASIEEVNARQKFVQELTSDFSWWQELQAKLFPLNRNKKDYQKFIADYLAKPLPFPNRSIFKGYIAVAPYLFLALFIGSYFKAELLTIPIVLAVVHVMVSLFFSNKISLIASGLNKGGDALGAFAPAIKQIEERDWKNQKAIEMLLRMQRQNGLPISVSIQRLATLLNRLDARLNAFMGLFLNAFLLWDFKQVHALQDWQSSQSQGILEALEMLTSVEAIGSFAVLKFNHPEWAFPLLVSHSPTFEAKGISHPLIKDDKVVANDYSLQDHRLALVTGSNMAGKSTFLRTIGVNAVLCLSGAPVCAAQMKMSDLRIATYMRIRDSISESTSTFKAELNRLQKILALVKNQKNTFFLLDEMLRGTNSMDKYLGSKAIIEKLIEENGVGVVATHDLKLAELAEKYPAIVKNFHFDIQVKDEEMLFDYKLKTGPCTLFNASLLLKKIGIEIR